MKEKKKNPASSKHLYRIVRSRLCNSAVIVFDIEADGDGIREFAFTHAGELIAAVTPSEINQALISFRQALNRPDAILAGHNITAFDIPLLRKKIPIPDTIPIADTLHIETLLAPTRKCAALKTNHHAGDDVCHTLDLLINQMIRLMLLPPSEFKKIEPFLNGSFLQLVYRCRMPFTKIDSTTISTLHDHFESESNRYFIHKEFGKDQAKTFRQFLDENIHAPGIFVAPREFYPILTEYLPIQVIGDDSDYSRVVSETHVAQLPDGMLEKYLLQSYIGRCRHENKLPTYANLPGRIKIALNKKNISTSFVTEPSTFCPESPVHYCVPPEKLKELMHLIQKSNRPVIIVERDLINLSHKRLLKRIDYTSFQQRLNQDSFWIHFDGGQSRVEIDRNDLPKLGISDVTDDVSFFWIEKTSFDTFHVWGTYDVLTCLQNKLGKKEIFAYSFAPAPMTKDHCFHVVPRSRSNQLSITRYNPETRYRDRYWTYQTFLVKHIVSISSSPVILIINQKTEKQKLYDYFTSIRYYIPGRNASLIRQIQLLIHHPEQKKLMIISKEQIPDMVMSDELDNFNFIIDSFELEEKWYTAKGTGLLSRFEKSKSSITYWNDVSALDSVNIEDNQNDPPDDDHDGENNIIDSVSVPSCQDVFVLLKIQKPIIDHYRWLFQSAGKNTVVWLADSRLGDFAGLEEAWSAHRKFIPVWDNDAAYKKDYSVVKQYFQAPTPKDRIHIDVPAAKNALRDVFLKEGDVTHDWFDYQHDFLNAILPADNDILVTLPTGGGKSVLFQAPALYRGSISGRLTIVVTPLKALMEDHVSKLWELHFWGSVEYINQDRKDTPYIYRRIAGGEILLLYMTPERFRSKSFINALRMRLENDGGFEYAVYDEAHCISQWGLDFRPDYLNSTNINLALKQKSTSPFPVLLFSATVSEQIYNDFQNRFNHSIRRLKNHSHAYNPLREHIAIQFETTSDNETKLMSIAHALKDSGFDPRKSRCLIFVRTRLQAEELVEKLEQALNALFNENGPDAFTDRITYFHAGLNASERKERYSAFKSTQDKNEGADRQIYILTATKAFGMGMDIPNIHHVYHYGPSGTLEDYLQEVGRAGRNARQLAEAGFSVHNPIQTTCFLEDSDFAKLKTLLQTSKITWANLLRVYAAVIAYYCRFRDFDTQKDKPIVLPFNILSQTPDFDDIKDKDQLLRLSLYWLEKLKRIRLAFYAPAQLTFSAFRNPPEWEVESSEQRKLISVIAKDWTKKSPSASVISIELNRLLSAVQCSNTSELLKLIFKCQKQQILNYENKITLYPTKKKMDELKHVNEAHNDPFYPTVEAVSRMTVQLMEMIPEKQQIQFDGAILDELKRMIVPDIFNPHTMPWCLKSDGRGSPLIDDKRIHKEQQDFEQNKVKFAFTLTDFIPTVRHQTLYTHVIGQNAKVVQVIYNGCRQKTEWKAFLREFKKDLISLLMEVTDTFITQNIHRYEVSDLILKLGLEEKSIEYIENLFSFAKWLGYLHYDGSFLPMGIELYLQSKIDIRHEENHSPDKDMYDEFQATQKLRELRLIALECLSEIHDKKEKDAFITRYFSCRDSGEIISLLISHFGEDHDAIKAFRDAALTEEFEELRDEQKAIYKADMNQNIQVIAGPGSGKTRTLILRVARFMHTEAIQPENILVLAYNRAVVVELKERLANLFKSLGYAYMVHRLKVFTFHGFCKYCLRESVRDLTFDQWVPQFIKTAKNQPGIIANRLGVIKYVFVDEFQDITKDRLKLLYRIADPSRAFVMVIGDPNQSIYGYERVSAGGSRSPRECYDAFARRYSPVEMHITENHRSYSRILEAAVWFLSHNRDRFNVKPLKPLKNASHNCMDLIRCTGINNEWIQKLGELIAETHPETKEHYRQIAVMFRINNELFRAYNLIEQEKETQNWNIRTRIQGEGEEFTRIREIAWIMEHFCESRREKRISSDVLDQYRTFESNLRVRFPDWDYYYADVFMCLLLEFDQERKEDSTYDDLLEFIQEVSRKGDGQLGKMYANHSKSIGLQDRSTEIVLTTMHKVKGLEFDAVVIPASFQDLAQKPGDTESFREYIEEERRLMYVAYTRAKYRLVAYYGEKEKALINGREYTSPEAIINGLGIDVPSGLKKFFISWGATAYGNRVFNRIERTLKVGAAVSLKRHNKWFLYYQDFPIACLNRDSSDTITAKAKESRLIDGFRVSNIYRCTLEDTRQHDETHGTTFLRCWTGPARRRGYIYLVEFSGYGTPRRLNENG